jgi:hypothetical protein
LIGFDLRDITWLLLENFVQNPQHKPTVNNGSDGRLRFLWASLHYFRRIVGAGPEKQDEKSIREYYSSTVIGTMIRSFGLFLGFMCPILFVIASFSNHDDDKVRFAAILCAIACGLAYAFAGYVEEFFYGKPKE